MHLYNTMTRTVEKITPPSDRPFKIYSCGLTVYSQPHIGNWVAYIYCDMLVRTLVHSGFKVERVQNITDVGHLVSDDDDGEDKMEKGAKREGLTAWQVADKYIKVADIEAYELLGLIRPDKIVRATSLIPEQIEFVRGLEEKGYTYIIDDEGVYFDTSLFKNYGRLGRVDTEGLMAGARVPVKGKRNITDFALWKFSPLTGKRDMEWDSPWGIGFPGWHLECSAIILNELGKTIDVHTGGIDHIPVHHTNEIAQSESLLDVPLSKHWFHNNHIKINGTKLSKSLENSFTLQDIIDKGYSLEAFKLLVASSHYRVEGNFSWDIMESSNNRYEGFKRLSVLQHQPIKTVNRESLVNKIESMTDQIVNAMRNDLDTITALTIIHSVFDICNTGISKDEKEPFVKFLNTIDALFGMKLSEEPDITNLQKNLIIKRELVRNAQDWSESDKLRDQLLEQGIALSDSKYGQLWHRK